MKGAHAYAQLGWAVIPLHDVTAGVCSCSKGADCPSAGKHPRLNDWSTLATSDADTVADWAEQYPAANVGVATGTSSGFFVLDVDPDSDGDNTLDALVEEHGELPLTAQAITGSGGTHYLFTLPDFAVFNTASKVGPGIDTRGNGGQIVVAPSVSAKGPYRWVHPPWSTPLAPAPAWILDVLRAQKQQIPASAVVRGHFPAASPAVLEAARAALEAHGPAIEGNGGDEHTFVAAAMLVHDFALTDAEAWPMLTEWNETCQPPWDEDALRAKLHGGEKYATRAYGIRRAMDSLQTARKWIADWQLKPGGEPMEIIEQVRTLRFDDPARRQLILDELQAATGLKPKVLALPPTIDTKATEELAARKRAFQGGASKFIDSSNPLATAKQFLVTTYDDAKRPEFVRWQGETWRADQNHYVSCSDETILATLYAFAEGKQDVTSNGPVKPDRSLIENIAHAFRAAAHVDVPAVPAWLGKGSSLDPADIVAFCNGLLHVPTRELYDTTRQFFTLNAVTFDYDPDAPPPAQWERFLADLWPDDLESVETLQELFGIALTQDTSFQKIFTLIGPKRSGKGTIARVLTELVGLANVASPTLPGLGQHFGLEGLIGKTLAVVSDARLGARADLGAITENLLRISGEDTISVPRKHRGDWTAKLTARFLLLSNELPHFVDQSGALASRFVMLRLTRSFLGSEDRGLTAKLLGELPGIANWALAGLDRLRARGHFRQPSASADMVQQLDTLASPIKAFVADCCELAPGAQVSCQVLFEAWRIWSTDQGRSAGSLPMLGRNLGAAFPEIRTARPRTESGRERRYEGIRLATASAS